MKTIIFLIIFTAIHSSAHAMGNHPESSLCPTDKPHFVFCSHSLHNLEGWYGGCYPTRQEAEKAAIEHANKEHNGNTRWTGVKQNRPRNN
jgi:hypothetical protein